MNADIKILAGQSVTTEDSVVSAKPLRLVGALISPFKVFRYWAKSVGWRAALTWCVFRTKKAIGLKLPETLTLKPRQAKYPIAARLGGSSDMDVFHQIFMDGEYDCIPISSPNLILDLGANVGYASAYFLSRFPAATVVAVEPDPENWKLCCKNLAPYGDRAKVVLGGIWSKRCGLVISRGTFGDGRQWATQVRAYDGADSEATVEGWDVPSILDLAGEARIDLLKVDIEGSEREIFGESSSSWLPKVRNICIELHGQECEEVFLNALNAYEYDHGISGELTICFNLKPKLPAAF